MSWEAWLTLVVGVATFAMLVTEQLPHVHPLARLGFPLTIVVTRSLRCRSRWHGHSDERGDVTCLEMSFRSPQSVQVLASGVPCARRTA